jgi:large subunit ribosomal protein L18
MDRQRLKKIRQLRRRNHVRKNIVGNAERPRLTVHRSSKHISVQLIDDLRGLTLASASTTEETVQKAIQEVSKKPASYGGNINAAKVVGKKIAEVAKEKGIKKAAFDRGHYRYHGRVKALADAAREGGLQF